MNCATSLHCLISDWRTFIGLDLYYDELVEYAKTPLGQIFQALDDLKSAKAQIDISISKLERGMLSKTRMKAIEDEIRSIKPQSRGSVVSSGGFNLPLSGTKKLNLSNTPILIVRDEPRPLYVFPCKSGEHYYDFISGIKFLSDNLPNLIELPVETEESITDVIQSSPGLLEVGMSFVSKEIETSTGRVDLLFQDKNGRLLLVEVERQASDQSVGQILRLCAGYEGQHELKFGMVRGAIVCKRINKNVLAATKRSRDRSVEDRSFKDTNRCPAPLKAAEYFSV